MADLRRIARVAAAALTLSASALVGVAVQEDYRGTAYLPTKADRPTLGFGATAGVRLGDTTTPPRALVRLLGDVGQVEAALHRPSCIGTVPLYQREWDAYVSLAYNIGAPAFCRSTLVRLLHRQPPDYAGACKQILRWDKQAGRVLPGLQRRRESEFKTCMGVTA